MGTKDNPGEFDCHASASADEPIFTLRARDPQAPELVRRWAQERHQYFTLHRGPWTNREQHKRQEAFDCADAMERWRKENVGSDKGGYVN